MTTKKQRRLEKKLSEQIRQKQNITPSQKIEKLKLYGLLLIVLTVYLSLSLWQINSPFIHVSEDTNGTNGVAAANLARFGFLKLKFGLYNRWLNDISGKELAGKFYSHHPIGFLTPTAIFYKLFGVSETTTRAGPLFLSLIAVVLFYFALFKIFKAPIPAFLCSLVFVILPGMVYYGKHLDMSPASLAFILISFSLFIFHYFAKKKIYFYLALFSIFLGGLTAWHYFFLPLGIWVFILLTSLGKQTTNRKLYLWLIPILVLLAFLINIYHNYILNGIEGINSWKTSFFYRSARQPFVPWLNAIFSRMQLNYNLFFIIVALIGFIYSLFKIKTEQNLLFFLPLVLLPFFILLIFQQWSTHPFGPIYFGPLIAIASGLIFYYVVKNFGISGWLVVFILLALGLTLSIKNLLFFYDKFLILGPKDTDLLKKYRTQIQDNELCFGGSNFGIDLAGITSWYLQKEILESPGCFATTSAALSQSKNLKYGLVFAENFGDFYKNEIMLFRQNGFNNLIECGNNWCLISR